MLDLILRTLGFCVALVAFYLVVLLFLFREEIRRTIVLRRKYGYTWSIAWSVALTDSAIDRQLRRAKQFRRPL